MVADVSWVPDPAQPTGPALQLALLRWLETKREAAGFYAGHSVRLQVVGRRGKTQLAEIEDKRR